MGRQLLHPSSFSANSIHSCAVHCFSDSNCKSFGIKRTTLECVWSAHPSYVTSSAVASEDYVKIYDAETNSTLCSEEWTLNPIGMSCVQIFIGSTNRNAASRNCEQQGASLLMLNTEEVYEWYQSLVAIDSSWSHNVWVGAVKYGDNWTWANGELLDESKFKDNQAGNPGNCIAMNEKFEWVPLPCDVNHRKYVCEKML